MTRRCRCGREIWDALSVARGTGPVCWARLHGATDGGIPSRRHEVSPGQTAIDTEETEVGATKVITWDWKGQPDIKELDRAILAVFNGINSPRITLVPDTGSDEYAAVIAAEQLTPDEAQDAYKAWWRKVMEDND